MTSPTDPAIAAAPIEIAGRAAHPLVTGAQLAGLRLQRSDLDAAQRFFVDFGLSIEDRTSDRLVLRGTADGPACLTIDRAEHDRFGGPVFVAHNPGDLGMLAAAWETDIVNEHGHRRVATTDPSGTTVTVYEDGEWLGTLAPQEAHGVNRPGLVERLNDAVRPERRPSTLARLGHVAVQTPRFRATLEWYLEHLGLIVSEFQYSDALVDSVGPTRAFMRVDRGDEPVDHHCLVLTMSPGFRFEHAGFECADLDAMAMGAHHLEDQGHRRAWGIGRQRAGSHLFDHWYEPAGCVFEHYADGDRLDTGATTAWDRITDDAMISWGPPQPKDFPGRTASARRLTDMVGGLLDRDSDVTPRYVREISRRNRG